MKFHLRWQILLAVIGFGLIAALLSFQVQTETLCTTRVPATGGTFIEGIVGIPRRLNPLLSDPYPIERDLVDLIFDGLTQIDDQGQIVPALAEKWEISEDQLTVRFFLRRDILWHDGEPLTARDVVFTTNLMQDDAFPGPASLKLLWQAVQINQIDDYTVDFTLPEPFSPFLEATTRGILPAHKLQGVTAATLADSEFNLAPVGTGPFMVPSGQDWPQSHTLHLIPNPTTWRQGTKVSGLEIRFFADESTMINALAEGEIHAVNQVNSEAIPALTRIPGIRLFTAPEPHYTTLLFNMNEEDENLLESLPMREALAFALDREVLVDTAVNGQGLPLEGPYPDISWAYNPMLVTPYGTNPISATAVLEAEGWLLPENEPIRQKEDSQLTLRLIGLDSQINRRIMKSIEEQWHQVGIGVSLALLPDLVQLQQALADQDFDVALVDILPTRDPDLYDFWSQESVVRGQNYGGWNNRRASEALEAGRQTWGVEARRPFYDTFQRLFNSDLPALPLFQHVYTYALSPQVNQAEIGRIDRPRDRYHTLAEWFLLFRDATISCPAEAAN